MLTLKLRKPLGDITMTTTMFNTACVWRQAFRAVSILRFRLAGITHYINVVICIILNCGYEHPPLYYNSINMTDTKIQNNRWTVRHSNMHNRDNKLIMNLVMNYLSELDNAMVHQDVNLGEPLWTINWWMENWILQIISHIIARVPPDKSPSLGRKVNIV